MKLRFFAALLPAMLCTAAQASTYSEFNAGVASYGDRDWNATVLHMTAALAATDLNSAFRAPAHYDRAVAYAALGKFDEALPDLTATLAADATYLQAYTLRGNIYLFQKNYTLAATDFSYVIQGRPRSKAAYLSRVEVYEAQQDHDRAIADMTYILQLDPNDGIIYGARGEQYRLQGKFPQAMDDGNAAVKHAPDNPATLTDRGITYQSMGDYAHAEADFETALRLGPDRFDARVGLGFTQWELGQFTDALKTFQAVRGQEKKPSPYVDLMIWASGMKTGDVSAAELKADRATMGAHGWPLPVADLVLGAATPEETLKSASIGDAGAQAIQTCEVDFYVGLWREAHGDKPGAVQLLSSLPENCAANVFEGAAAAAERKRLQ